MWTILPILVCWFCVGSYRCCAILMTGLVNCTSVLFSTLSMWNFYGSIDMVDHCKLPHPIPAVYLHRAAAHTWKGEDMQHLSRLSAYLPDTLKRRLYLRECVPIRIDMRHLWCLLDVLYQRMRFLNCSFCHNYILLGRLTGTNSYYLLTLNWAALSPWPLRFQPKRYCRKSHSLPRRNEFDMQGWTPTTH